jgi:hypothetical protein
MGVNRVVVARVPLWIEYENVVLEFYDDKVQRISEIDRDHHATDDRLQAGLQQSA